MAIPQHFGPIVYKYSPSWIARDVLFEYRRSPEGALVFGKILGIEHVVDGEIYQARVRDETE